jgi:hypothetical protein
MVESPDPEEDQVGDARQEDEASNKGTEAPPQRAPQKDQNDPK